MPNLNGSALTLAFETLWLEALINKNFQPVTQFLASGAEKLKCAENCFKGITAVETDHKRLCIQFGNKDYAFDYDVFPVSKNIFQHIQELRIFHQPDDLQIYDSVFGHDIKRIHIWDKKLPEKYCDIQKSQNSLEEVYVYSRFGFDLLSIVSPSCRKVQIYYFKLENIRHMSYTTFFPSVEHLIVSEAYVQKNLNPEDLKQFCEFLSKTFPNLKQLDMEIDYLNNYDVDGTRKYAFDMIETVNIDPKLFEVFPSQVKGTIKFVTFKDEKNFEKCAEIVKDGSAVIKRSGVKRIEEKHEIHEGLFLQSNVSFCVEYVLSWHHFFGHKCPPVGPFSLQHGMCSDVGTKKKVSPLLSDLQI